MRQRAGRWMKEKKIWLRGARNRLTDGTEHCRGVTDLLDRLLESGPAKEGAEQNWSSPSDDLVDCTH